MAQKRPIPVRLSDDLVDRLDAAAERMGTNRAAIIRFCTETFVKHVELHGRAALPPDWDKLLAGDDGRKRGPRIPIQYDGDGLAIGGMRLNDAEALALAEGAGMTMAQLRDLSEASVDELLKVLRLERPADRPARATKRKRPATA